MKPAQLTPSAKTLLILRHAKAEKNIELPDHLRALKKSGKQAAIRMGLWLKSQGLQPDLIITSPAKRAFATAKKVCSVMDMPIESIWQDERLYNATITLVLQVIHECPGDKQRLLLVGHNPALEEFVHYMVNVPLDEPDSGRLLPKAALAQLELKGAWEEIAPHSARLLSITKLKDADEG